MRTHAWVRMGLGLALLLAASASARADRKVDEKVPCDADGTVSISNVSGRIDVVAWDRKEVQVTGTLDDKVEELRVDPDGGDVEIEVVLPRRIRGRGGDADLEIRVPKGARVEVETVSAEITAKGTKGQLELQSVSGSVDVEAETGSAEVETVSGEVRVNGRLERTEVQSVSGTVALHNTTGEAEASTTSGDIEVEGGDFERVSCTSVSGRIVFRGTPKPRSEIELENFSGSVVAYLPGDLDAEVSVETFSGSIDSEIGGKVHREEFGPGASLDVTHGKGSVDLSISTFSGSVELKKK